MRKFLAAFILFVSASIAAFGQAYIPVTGARIKNNVSQTLTGQLRFTVTDASNVPITYTPQGGSPTTAQILVTVVAGSIPTVNGFQPTIPNPVTMSPAGSYYRMEVIQGGTPVLTFPLISINTPGFSVDGFSVPKGVTASGLGMPQWPCTPGSMYNDTSNPAPYPWVCSQLNSDNSIVWTQNPSIVPMCQKGNSQAIASPINGTGPPYCLPVTQAWSTPGYVVAGPAQAQGKNGQVGMVAISDLCANGACGTSGGGNPAGNPQDIQFHGATNVFDADLPGRFTYDKVYHMLRTNVNTVLNTDIYRTSGTGNDGIANALAAPECGANCEVYQPASSTDSTWIPTPASGKMIRSDRGLSQVIYAHNPSGNKIADTSTLFQGGCNDEQEGLCRAFLFDTPDTMAASIAMRPVGEELVVNQSQWGTNYGNAPGSGSANWTVFKMSQHIARLNTKGITQNISDVLIKHATGDVVFGQNVDSGVTDGGSPDWSAEGGAAYRGFFGETSDYYHGIVGTGASAGATSIPVSYNSAVSTNNRNASSAGAFVLDITQGTISGTVTGPVTGISSLPGTVGSVPIDTPVTPSTAYGKIGCTLNIANTNNTNIYATQTCPVTNIAGSNSGGFVNGRAYILGDFPEEVPITVSAPASGGTQTVTMTFLHPHPSGRGTLWQGSNVMGTFISYDRFMGINGFREAFHVAGAIDANHLAVEESYSGSNGPYQAYLAPINIATLSKSGTTVTALPTDSNQDIYQFSNQASAVVAGCSDPSLNGTVTNLSVNLATRVITWTQSGGGVSCPSATLQLPPSTMGFHLYPGAEQLGPAVDSPTSIPLGVNSVPWTAGDQIEIPHHPYWSGEFTHWIHTVNNALEYKKSNNGIAFHYGGAGINGNYKPFSLDNLNPCSMYQGCGGLLIPPPAIYIGGFNSNNVNGGAISMKEAPLGNAPVFSVKDVDPSVDPSGVNPITWFQVGYSTGSELKYRPVQKDYVANAFTAGVGIDGSLGYGYFRGGRFWIHGATSNDASSFGGAYFSIDGVNEWTRMGICSKGTTLKEVTFGTCTPAPTTNGDINVTDGKINVASIRAQTDATVGKLTVGLQSTNLFPTLSYSGVAGTTQRIYYYAPQTPIGIQGPVPSLGASVQNTATTLDATHFVTITCPTTLQGNWPTGTTYHVLYRSSVSNTVDLGTCPIGGSVIDDGTLTNGAPGLANITLNADMNVVAGQYQVADTGAVAFWSSNRSGTLDTFINRIGPNKLGIGSTMGNSGSTTHNGTLELGGLQLDNATGVGPQCLQADNTGVITGTGAPCGSGGGGGSGTVTNVSKDDTGIASLITVSVSNPTTTPQLTFSLSQAGAHQFWGNNTGTLGAPGYFQPAFTDLAGVATPAQLPAATTAALGGVKPDGTTITVDVDGTIHSAGGGGGTNPTADGVQYWDNTAHSWSAVSGLKVTAGAVSGIHVTGGTGLVASSGIIDGYFADFVTTATTVAVAPAVTGGICDDGTTARSCAGAKYYNNVTGGTSAVTYTLPAAVAGSWYCFQNYTSVTSLMTIQTSGAGQYIDVQGTPTTSGGNITMPGAAGDAVCVEAADTTHWFAHASSGTATPH